MNSFPDANAAHPEWSMPKNGDFAGYVERLTAAHVVRLPQEPGRVPHFGEMMQGVKAGALPATSTSSTSTIAPTAERPDLQALKAPVAGMLGLVQLGLAALVVIQVALLVVAGLGSAVGVAAAVLAWWLVGRWKRALGGVHKPGVPAAASLAALQQQLQALAQQKTQPARRK